MKFIYLASLLLLSNTIFAEELNISTTSGISQGFLINGVANWDDIPYAQPPVGDLRWKAPREILESNKLLEPKINNFCIQKPSGMGGSEFNGDEFYSGSEDCLYLDIKAPKSKSNNLLPVMFWIHGGGNTSWAQRYL
jgi:para-nitrobenzyl esterase